MDKLIALQRLAEKIGCPNCFSKKVKVMFVPEPEDIALNSKCLKCNFEFEVNPR